MKTAADNDNWRDKYFDSLSRLENEQRRFHSMEATLKRVGGRLCTASLGQSAQLDAQIKRLQTAIRREVTSEELDQITPSLTDAIQQLDQAPPAPILASGQPIKALPSSPQPIAGDDRIRAILIAVLAELRRDAELIASVDALDAKLTGAIAPEQLPEILSSLTDLVGQRIRRIETAKQEVEVLLSHMVGKLDEIGRFVAEQNKTQSESQASSETLNIQLVDEMKAMGESVETASNLQQIRTQVRARLDSIDRHLQEFRRREATLSSAIRTRNEQMRSRIVELESEANRLQSALKDEQRLSTIDALTNIPNRLAYEKRVEEEVKRWQRFKQATSIAVLDVDHFKRINDTYGHRAGDRVLRTLAEHLAKRIRGTDFLARFGGEEFVLILPGTTRDDAMHVIEEMRISVSTIGFHFRGAPVSITVSCGLTALQAGDSAGGAFDRADQALYQAKENGRNRCVSL